MIATKWRVQYDAEMRRWHASERGTWSGYGLPGCNFATLADAADYARDAIAALEMLKRYYRDRAGLITADGERIWMPA